MLKKLLAILVASTFAFTAFAQAPTPSTPSSTEAKKDQAKPAIAGLFFWLESRRARAFVSLAPRRLLHRGRAGHRVARTVHQHAGRSRRSHAAICRHARRRLRCGSRLG